MLDKDFLLVFLRMNKINDLYDFYLDKECLKKYHNVIFSDILDNSGKFRNVNIMKYEDLLDNRSVNYSDYRNINRYLDYDIDLEKKKDYSKFSREEFLYNISDFTVRLWSTHPFLEGNTRTISIYIRNYLRDMGYETNNILFLNLFKYYRDSLVIASYCEFPVMKDYTYLMSFYEKIIFDKKKSLNDIKKLVKNK